MKQRLLRFFIIALSGMLPASLFSAGSQALREPANRGGGVAATAFKYIIPPDEISVEALIERVGYSYPLPKEAALNVVCAADILGDIAYVQVGLRAKSRSPMNIAFVIDKSGSMAEDSRMVRVKRALAAFTQQATPEDMLSLIVFDDTARVLVEPVSLKTEADRNQFLRRIDSMQPDGGTNIYDGMERGYQAILGNYNPLYANQVLCLTDGKHTSTNKTREEILALAATYLEKGIVTSTIALGHEADVPLMSDIAARGGGKTLDIADRGGVALEPLVMPVARALKMELRLADGVRLRETWGYNHEVSGNFVSYRLDSLDSEAMETLVVEVEVTSRQSTQAPLATFSVEYLDEQNVARKQGPYPIRLGAEALAYRDRISNPYLKEVEGFIALGRGLLLLADGVDAINSLQAEYAQVQRPGTLFHETRERLIQRLSDSIKELSFLQEHLSGIRAALGGNQYTKELELLESSRIPFIRAYYLYLADNV
ncbi:MAG: VWA domain-containing protein [Treponema sp.]|jgi:Mg-chelatase subunit ChlD|nr:VWA domain-containing protein [Treponema sp.]